MSDDHDDLDLRAWRADTPPPDFAERVLARVRDEARASTSVSPPTSERHSRGVSIVPETARRRVRPYATALVVVATLAAGLVVGPGRADDEGTAIARERTEVSIGQRARAVLEPGANLDWRGDQVTQTRGDVFYRVEPGATFVVHTPVADVEVRGTCFRVQVGDEGSPVEDTMMKRDMKAGAVGAVVAIGALVAVYEGKVVVSRAGSHVDLRAGEQVEANASGIHRTTHGEDGAASSARAGAVETLAQANDNLVDQVRAYKRRIDAVEKERLSLEAKLRQTEAKLSGPDAKHDRNEFDLDQNDWKELAKDGTVKYQMPCPRKDGWSPKPDVLDKLGLAPNDGATIRDAYARSYERVWSQIRPLCIEALGNAETVDKIGLSTCPHLIRDVAAAVDPEAANTAQREVAEIRAGLRPPPAPNEKVHPVLRMFLALTDANPAFEADLARTFGPEDAHRIAFADGLCTSRHGWGGPPKDPPAPAKP